MYYSSQIWARVRTAYESGKYHSLDEMHKSVYEQLKKEGIRCPGINAVKARSASESWNKYKSTDKIKKTQEQMLIERFAKNGLPEDKVINKIIDLVNSDKTYERCKGLEMYRDVVGWKAPRRTDVTSKGEQVQSGNLGVVLLPANRFDPPAKEE